MRLGTCLLYEGRTLQGARTKLADFCSAPMAGSYSAVDTSNDPPCDVGIDSKNIFTNFLEQV